MSVRDGTSVHDLLPLREDCRHYVGEKPCVFRRPCPGCEHYDPMGEQILIIKLGAMGDVLRTTPILRAIKERWPRSHVTWLVKPGTVELLQGNPFIDVILPDNAIATRVLQAQHFDIAFNFDKEPAATAALQVCNADEKLGFGLTPQGKLTAVNPGSTYSLVLGTSDALKFFTNERTYQDCTFEMAGFPYHGEEYVLPLSPTDRAMAEQWRRDLRLGGGPIIGLNTGAGDIFATKRMSPERTAAIAREIKRRDLGQVLLLGGPSERESHRQILESAGEAIIDTGTDNPLRSFIALVSILDAMVCVDTLAMHLALALRKQVVALFGSTCHQEVDLYGRGAKLVTSFPCSPCYRRTCPYFDYCLEDLEVARIVDLLEERLNLLNTDDRSAPHARQDP